MICKGCEKDLPDEQFPLTYNKRYPGARHTRCKTCFRKLPSQKAHDRRKHSRRRIRKQVAMKQKAIAYLGGKCQRKSCPLQNSFDIPYYAFDFHHRDPSEKEFTVGVYIREQNAKDSCWDGLQKELDKCDLVCCLCHRIIHFEISEK